MADKTGIAWTDATWNPLAGCSIVSPACTNCYAMAMAARIERMQIGTSLANKAPYIPSHYAGLTIESKSGPVWNGKIVQANETILTQPLRWKRPRRIFVNSMSDLFHESVPDEWIDRIFAVMALAPQHTFQILTKRAKRMREYCSEKTRRFRIGDEGHEIAFDTLSQSFYEWPIYNHLGNDRAPEMPLPNVWLGVTAEDQTRADERWDDLAATPAARRFVSIEPMLGAIDLTRIVRRPDKSVPGPSVPPMLIDALNGTIRLPSGIGGKRNMARLDWVIAGGESGPKARPSHPDWFRALRDQCAAAGVPFFFKQWGEWLGLSADKTGAGGPISRWSDATMLSGEEQFYRVGKKRAGDLLDGVRIQQFPEAAHV